MVACVKVRNRLAAPPAEVASSDVPVVAEYTSGAYFVCYR